MRPLALLPLVLLFSCAPEVYAPKTIDDAPLSEAGRSVLSPYLANAKRGSANAHFYLGMTFCGELCLQPQPGMSDAQKEAQAEHLKDVKHYGIEPDYIRSYAHFLLADDATSSEESYRKLIEGKMSNKQLEAAHLDAGNWKAEAAKAPVVAAPAAKKLHKSKYSKSKPEAKTS